jgi:hypothetical protein
MKLTAGHFVFRKPRFPDVLGRRLALCGEDRSIQLLETALVVEGDQFRFRLLGLERFFRGTLGERTQVTIPYSRIESAGVRPMRWAARLLFSLILGATLAGVAVFSWALEPSGAVVFTILVFAFALAGCGGVVVATTPCYVVTLQFPSGELVSLGLAIQDGALHQAFDEALQQNRATARHSTPSAVPAGCETSAP